LQLPPPSHVIVQLAPKQRTRLSSHESVPEHVIVVSVVAIATMPPDPPLHASVPLQVTLHLALVQRTGLSLHAPVPTQAMAHDADASQ
jgi:hypothetical protein